MHCCLLALHTPILPNPLTVTSCFNIKVNKSMLHTYIHVHVYAFCTLIIHVECDCFEKGFEKVLCSSPGQQDFLVKQDNFHWHLPNRQGFPQSSVNLIKNINIDTCPGQAKFESSLSEGQAIICGIPYIILTTIKEVSV